MVRLHERIKGFVYCSLCLLLGWLVACFWAVVGRETQEEERKEVEKGGTSDMTEGWVLKRHESPMRNSMVEWTSKTMNIQVCFHIHLLCSYAVDCPPTPKSCLKSVLPTNTLCEWVSSGNWGRDELISSLKEPQNSGGFIPEQEKPGRRGGHEWQGSAYVLSGASDPRIWIWGCSSQSFSEGRQVQTGLWKTGIALLGVYVVSPPH